MKKLFAQIRSEKVIEGLKLIPASEEDSEVLKNYHINQIVSVGVTGVKKQRSYLQIKFWWAMCRMVLENNDNFKSKEAVSSYVKIKIGYIAHYVEVNGAMHLIPGSISYEKMEHMEMCGLMDKAITEFGVLVGMTPEEMEEVYQKELKQKHA